MAMVKQAVSALEMNDKIKLTEKPDNLYVDLI